MRFAAIMPQQSRQKAIDAFSGGLNTKEPVEVIGDNQLLACDNMYFEAGELTTRPGFYTDSENVVLRYNNSYIPEVLSRFSTSDGKFSLIKTKKSLFVWNGSGKLIGSFDNPYETEHASGFFAQEKQNTVLFFGKYTDGTCNIAKIILSDNTATYSTGIQPYTPTVFINAKPTTSLSDAASGGVSYEGYNLLSARLKSLWTTDGEGIYYFFLTPVQSPFSFAYTDQSGNIITWTIYAGYNTSSYENVEVNGSTKSCRLVFNSLSNCLLLQERVGDEDVAVALSGVGFSDNVTVTATRRNWESTEAEKVCASTFSTWFGGTASGVGDGTRLFISGNSDSQNIVRYSDVNNPVYFPENNFLYVGSEGQPVTAFGKQNAYLVIFKPHEIYACEYAWSAVSGEDVAAGIIPDVTADAYFPLRQVHGGVGCDCPNTVQLCGNHLVWANYEDKRVYTLSNFSQYTDRNVRDISWVIEPNIKESLTSSASSAIWGDFYVLLCSKENVSGLFSNQKPQEFYLFDFTQSGFTYYASYYDEKRASTRIPWYRWTFNVPFNYVNDYVVNKVELTGKNEYFTMLTVYHIAGTDFYVQYNLGEEAKDRKVTYSSGVATTSLVDFVSEVLTKQYNFDMTQYLKTIEGAFLKATGHGEIRLSWNTSNDVKTNQYRKEINTEYPSTIRVPYRASRVRTAALGIQVNGKVKIGELIWNFRRLGESK